MRQRGFIVLFYLSQFYVSQFTLLILNRLYVNLHDTCGAAESRFLEDENDSRGSVKCS